ncbi:hypothetical protein ACMC5R_11565 [Deferribacteres bacterium DY0037]
MSKGFIINISFNNPFENIFSTENISIKGVSDQQDKNENNVSQNDKVNLSSIAKKLDNTLRKLRNSDSVEKVQDIKNVLELEENTGLYELIMPSDENIDGLVNTLTKNGYEKPKTNEEINDVQWGVIVRLGNTIGIEDEEVLASQT